MTPPAEHANTPPCPVCGQREWQRQTWFDEDEYPAVVCGACGNGWYGGVENDEYPASDQDPWGRTLAEAKRLIGGSGD